MKTKLLRLFSLVLVIAAMATALFVGVRVSSSNASTRCQVWWDHCTVTQHYGVNLEHGIDIWTTGKPITALLPGKVTFDQWVCWGTGRNRECVQDITWQLLRPVCYRGACADYMYVQIRTSSVWKGERIQAGQKLGMSGSFIEIGFNRYPAYGVWPYPWRYSGIDPLKIWPWL